ncbi:MAG: Lrp/AsnC ligand binding domain-containing protein [Acidobacteriota bacterium]|nr:Lrp/AsnC ligand binding domain-containing protein [Acidobacteriota bacterium]
MDETPKKMEERPKKTVATVLVKSGRGYEEMLRTRLGALGQPNACSHGCRLRPQGPIPGTAGHPCGTVEVVEAAYCFGPFDFLLVLHGTDVGAIEDFVVHCLRSERDIVADTQTIVGLSLLHRVDP